jgi:extracellular factor (EF) 3-hydroxypalmitic acid methyl ester biosynthesis protein
VSAPAAGLAAYSLLTFRNSQGEKARGTLLKLTRTTVVFEVYNPYSIAQLSEVLQELTLWRIGKVSYQGRAIVTNLVNTGLMLIVSVTLIDDWLLLPETSAASDSLKVDANEFVAAWQKANDLRPQYQLAIGRLRSFLIDMQRWLEQAQVQYVSEEHGEDIALPSEFVEYLVKTLSPQASKLLSSFEVEAAALSESEVDYHKAYAQRDLHPLVMCSPFVHRTYSKPLGYAGDYEMVNMMLGDPYEGPTLFSKAVSAFNLKTGPVVAHRNRIDVLSNYLSKIAFDNSLKKRRTRVLNIGCGPAIEIQRFVCNSPLVNDCDFVLIDFNLETINYAKAKIDGAVVEHGRGTRVEFINISVHELVKKSKHNVAGLSYNSFDFVYCAGLFDYISDKICIRLLDLFFQWAATGGTVLATNVHKRNASLFWMEHVLEWHLIYRDEEGMLELSPDRNTSKVFSDSTGQNIFLEVVK